MLRKKHSEPAQPDGQQALLEFETPADQPDKKDPKQFFKKNWKKITAVVCVAAVAAAVLLPRKSEKPAQADTSYVETALERRDITNTFSASGTIAAANTGSLTTAQAASATINGVSALASARFTYQHEQTVTATASGTVAALCVKEGASIRANTAIVQLSGTELNKQMQNAADSLANAQLSIRPLRTVWRSWIRLRRVWLGR